jgi:hypothetical protein
MTNDNEKNIEVTNNKNTIEWLHSRLAEIQAQLKAPKDKTHYKGWKHRSAEDILESVKPLLYGLSIIQSDEIVSMFPPFLYRSEEAKTADSYISGVYLKATATISNGTHSISAYGWAKEIADKKGLDEPQLTGMASSYARKYALCGLLGIDGSQDSDEFSDSQSRKTATRPTNPPQKTYYNQSNIPPASDEQKEKWKKSLLDLARNDESLLHKISPNFKNGIKSEKQYYFFANRLQAMMGEGEVNIND